MVHVLLTAWTIIAAAATCCVGVWAAVDPYGSAGVGLVLLLLGLGTGATVVLHHRQEAARRGAPKARRSAVPKQTVPRKRKPRPAPAA